MPILNAHLLPQLVEPAELAGSTCVVIDVLRATTTITYALAARADRVIACQEVDEALAVAANLPRPQVVLGGERQGLRIEGFDLGNSPAEYCVASVGGKTIVFTTTNGTRAMRHASEANDVLLGAFVNLSALCRALSGREQISLLCAGTNGQITREDVLLAGAIASRLTGGTAWELNDQAALARDAWIGGVATRAGGANARSDLALALRSSQGGRNLIALGLDADIIAASQIDRFDVVPRFDPSTGVILADARGHLH